jgi:hypothetical protein
MATANKPDEQTKVAAAKEAATPVRQISMEQAKEIIIENMFYKYLGAQPELDDRLRAAYKKRYGVDMMEMADNDEMRSVYLEGAPGHGKTATHEAACREFADLIGMRFLKNPSLQMVSGGKIGMNDFVYTVIELAGETSNKEVAGLMTKMKVEMPDGTKMDFMGHVQDWRLAATSMAGFGYVNWDDYVTASHQVQNAMLGMLLNGKSSNISVSMQDLISSDKVTGEDGEQIFKLNPDKAMKMRQNSSSVAMGMSGNRGERDGNKVYDLTTATSNRVIRFDVFDTLDNFAARTLDTKKDALSDAGVLGFLKANSEHFFKLAVREKGMMGQSATSRSWDALMTQARIIMHKNGGLGGVASMGEEGQMKVLNELMIRAGGTVGTETEVQLAAYYTQLFVGAAPIAQAIISKGEVDEKKIREKFLGGTNGSGMNFGHSLASALSTFATMEIAQLLKTKKDVQALQDPNSAKALDVRKVLCHFSYGLNQMNLGPLRSFALDQLSRRLHAAVPELFTANGVYRIPTTQTATIMAYGLMVDNQKYRNPEYFEDIKTTITQQGGFEDVNVFLKGSQFSAMALKS